MTTNLLPHFSPLASVFMHVHENTLSAFPRASPVHQNGDVNARMPALCNSLRTQDGRGFLYDNPTPFLDEPDSSMDVEMMLMHPVRE
jgi:hypothetical protein